MERDGEWPGLGTMLGRQLLGLNGTQLLASPGRTQFLSPHILL